MQRVDLAVASRETSNFCMHRCYWKYTYRHFSAVFVIILSNHWRHLIEKAKPSNTNVFILHNNGRISLKLFSQLLPMLYKFYLQAILESDNFVQEILPDQTQATSMAVSYCISIAIDISARPRYDYVILKHVKRAGLNQILAFYFSV